MPEADHQPTALPLVGEARSERGDAARNRRKVLDAARRILAGSGTAGLTMDAVASEAGVGKGTVFRRFGDRQGLVLALLDDSMREFQDDFLRGPPPLGPGAPAEERLRAFFLGYIRSQVENLEPALAMEALPDPPPFVFAPLLLHVAGLLREIDPQSDADSLARMLLAAFSPVQVKRMREQTGDDDERIAATVCTLLHGVI